MMMDLAGSKAMMASDFQKRSFSLLIAKAHFRMVIYLADLIAKRRSIPGQVHWWWVCSPLLRWGASGLVSYPATSGSVRSRPIVGRQDSQ